MNVHIRVGDISDINQLARCNKKNLPIYYKAEEFLLYLLSNKISVVVAEISDNMNCNYSNNNDNNDNNSIDAFINDDLVGYIMGKLSNDNFHILSIAVDKEYRKKGIGSSLLESFIKLNYDKCNSISLYVYVDNKVAINFYKKNGFNIIKRIPKYYIGTYDINNCDAYMMVYNIIKE